MFLQNKKGMSMVYVMISLIIIGITATALIKLSHKNAITQVNYSNSESARLAVHSGFEKALAFFQSDQKDTILAVLNKWYTTDKPANITDEYRWVVGKENEFDSIYSNCKFKVQILGFDAKKYSISLHSQGLTQSGNKASAVGTYYLDGLGFEQGSTSGATPTNALQMDNGNFEFNCQLTIEGNTSVFDKMKMNIGPVLFDGDIRIDKHRTSGAISRTGFDVTSNIKGNAYFAGPILTNKTMTIDGNAGFDDSLTFGVDDLDFEGDTLYINNGTKVDGASPADLDGADLIAYENATFQIDSDPNKTVDDCYDDADITKKNSKTTDLPGKLKLGKVPPKIFFNYKLPLKHPYIKTIPNNKKVTADTLNKWYSEQVKDNKLWDRDFMIVHAPSTYSTDNGKLIDVSTTQFSGRVILIVESTNWQEIKGFKTTDNAICAIYLSNFAKNTNAFNGLAKFRGFIYIDKATENVVFHTAIHSLCHYKGSIYAGENGSTKFDGGTGKHHKVTFDQSVINELDTLGIFTDPDSTTTSTDTTLVFKKPQLEAELLSRSF